MGLRENAPKSVKGSVRRNVKNYVGQKVWIEPEVRGRIIEITDRCVLVQEDHRWRVDGSKRNPIYGYGRNPNGECHIIPTVEVEYVGMDLHRDTSSDATDHGYSTNLSITS